MILKYIIYLFSSIPKTCQGPIQDKLAFNLTNRSIPEGLPIFNQTESLADAICCDSRYSYFAEPRFTYNHSDINLYNYLNPNGTTVFYDSVCGLPLFRVPVNRSLDDFKKETDEHGWPSFRQAEVIADHVSIDSNDFVYSKCGTHLGSNLPDDGNKKIRYCLDLVCISGYPNNY